MERYPGSDSPSSYASEISVIPSKTNLNDESFSFIKFSTLLFIVSTMTGSPT